MEEIILSLRHYWRFVDSETLALKILSQGIGKKDAWAQAKRIDRRSQVITVPSEAALYQPYTRKSLYILLPLTYTSLRGGAIVNYSAYPPNLYLDCSVWTAGVYTAGIRSQIPQSSKKLESACL